MLYSPGKFWGFLSASYVLWPNLNVTSHWAVSFKLELATGTYSSLIEPLIFREGLLWGRKWQSMYSCVCLYVMEFLERAGGCKLQARGHVRVTIQQALNLLLVVVLPSWIYAHKIFGVRSEPLSQILRIRNIVYVNVLLKKKESLLWVLWVLSSSVTCM